MRPVQDPTLHKSPKFTPEQHLAFAVVMQAIEDLQSSDETIRFEAHEFFLQPSGPWADMRQYYFDALDLNDTYVHEQLTARLDPPERPHKKWTYMEVLDILPRDRPFTSPRIAELTPLHVSQMTGRINHLIKEGYVVRIENGVYCRKDCEEEARKHLAPRETKMIPFKGFGTPTIRKPGETQEAILRAMRDGATTIREIGWELEADYNAVKCALDRLIGRGLVTRDTEGYYRLAPQSAVVAANG